MSSIILYHGSDHIINEPKYSLGKINNDYGKGFYCTDNFDLACEWAVKYNTNGFVNKYSLDLDNLKVLNLLDEKYNILNWIAILLKYRTFNLDDEISIEVKEYLLKNFLIDISKFDLVIGYRADDSYFSYAQSFISSSISLRTLSKAMYLGNLGSQIVLVSKEAFKHIKFIDSNYVLKDDYYNKFIIRDTKARLDYRNLNKNNKRLKDDIYALDIIREEIRQDDKRLFKYLLK